MLPNEFYLAYAPALTSRPLETAIILSNNIRGHAARSSNSSYLVKTKLTVTTFA